MTHVFRVLLLRVSGWRHLFGASVVIFVCVGFDQYAPMRHNSFPQGGKNILLSKHSDKHYNDWQEVIYVKKK